VGFGDASAATFVPDFEVHARSLVATPAFILAESWCIPRLAKIARHFVEARLVRDDELALYKEAVESTRRLLDSRAAGVAVVALAFLASVAIPLTVSPSVYPQWRISTSGVGALSIAGWWHTVVSIPILLMFVFGWLWRILLWTRFLRKMSRLHLQLFAAHPDHAGGLSFVGSSLRAFAPLGFALATIVAGSVAERRYLEHAPLLTFAGVVVLLLVVVVVLSVGPTLVFSGTLRAMRSRAKFEYGALALDIGSQFERRWLNRESRAGVDALKTEDFSATTDLLSIAANVNAIGFVPFGLTALDDLLIATLIPFVPVAIAVFGTETLINDIVKLLL
jgi:hypothetical protein